MNKTFSNKIVIACAATLLSAGVTGATLAAPLDADTGDAPVADQAKLEQQLDAARERLDKAAQEVAELSSQLGGPMPNRMMQSHRFGPGRALLGVQIDPASKGGARVLQVSPGGAAAEAGLQQDDLIVALDGKDLRKSAQPARELVERMRDLAPEQKVKVQVLRAGKTQSFELMPRPMPMFAGAMPMPPGAPPGLGHGPGRGPGPMHDGPGERGGMPMMRERGGDVMFDRRGGDFGGLELATLSEKLGGYFGTRSGVLVVRAGNRFGDKLQDGDVIVAIDGREPTSGAHATRILRSYQRGEKVSLKILRDRKTVTLDVT